MLLIFILCIIISDLSRRKIVVKTTSLIQKSLNFNIFLFFSKITLKIISFLNFLNFIIFLRAVNVSLMFDSRVRTIIFVSFIFCIHFIFCFFLIYVINFIFLFDFRFKRTLILRKKSIKIAIVDCLIVIFIQIFFSTFLLFSSISWFIFRNIRLLFSFYSRTRNALRISSY